VRGAEAERGGLQRGRGKSPRTRPRGRGRRAARAQPDETQPNAALCGNARPATAGARGERTWGTGRMPANDHWRLATSQSCTHATKKCRRKRDSESIRQKSANQARRQEGAHAGGSLIMAGTSLGGTTAKRGRLARSRQVGTGTKAWGGERGLHAARNGTSRERKSGRGSDAGPSGKAQDGSKTKSEEKADAKRSANRTARRAPFRGAKARRLTSGGTRLGQKYQRHRGCPVANVGRPKQWERGSAAGREGAERRKWAKTPESRTKRDSKALK